MSLPLRLALALLGTAFSLFAQPAYQPRQGLQGTLRMVGSDSIDPMVRLWAQEFEKVQPGVQFSITSHGSGTAPGALMGGESDLGHMSRAMSGEEAAAFEARLGHAPTGINVAFDALAIYVNHGNPVPHLTLAQLDAIYGSTRLSGAPRSIDGWWDLGLRSSKVWKYWVRPYTRDENSGSRAFFMEKVLQKGGAFKPGVRTKDQMGIMDVVGRDLNAIGYGPESYRNPSVRMVPLAAREGDTPCLPTLENIQSSRYPLARHLYIYVNREPGQALPDLPRAFLEFILSSQGQELARSYGAAPLSPEAAQAERAKLY